MAQTSAVTGDRSAWRLVLLTRLVGLVAGVVVAAQVAHAGRWGQGLMLSTAAFGLCVLLGTAIGETVVRPRPQAGVRVASLRPRRVRDHLPWTTPVVAVQLVLLAAVLVLGTLTASDDELGHSRELACSTSTFGHSHGPYPGAFYAAPLALALLVVLATAALAARQVVLRPRGMGGTEAADDALRRNSLDVVVAATGVAVGTPLFGVALTSGGAMRSLATAQPSCAAGWAGAVGVALLLVSLLALGSVSLLLGRLVFVPSPRL